MPQCVVCEEAITNPVCIECLTKEIRQWLGEKKASLIPLFMERVEMFESYNHETTDCIICNSNMNVCPHCVCMEVYNWLSEDYKEYAEEYLDLFNYELKQCLM